MIKRKLKPCEICGKPVFKIGAKVCSINCSLDYNALHPELVKNFVEQQAEKNLKKWRKESSEKLKSLSTLEGEAKRVFQEWVRLRDSDQPCISSGATKGAMHGGHYLSCEKYSGLIFHPFNCHKQTAHDNVFKHGNLLDYRKGLIKRYGLTFVENLEALGDANRVRKYTRDELIEIKKFYQAKIKAKDYTNEIFKMK